MNDWRPDYVSLLLYRYILTLIYNIYVDELNKQFKMYDVVCYKNEQSINHTMYADDPILISPTSEASISMR